MKILDQFNFFWQKHPEYAFKPLEIAVYAYLLNFCNGLGRKNPFNLSKDRLMFEMGVRTEDALDTARKRLREAGLLDYENGYGRGRTTLYTLLPPPAATAKKGVKNHPFSPDEEPASDAKKGGRKGQEKGGKKSPLLDEPTPEKGGEKGVKNHPNKGGTTKEKRRVKSICASAENDAAQKSLDFELFWEAYDKKTGRKVSEQKWAALTPAEQAAILDHAPRYRAATPDKQYRKDPATYLHQRTWEDEELPPPRGGHRPPDLTPAPALTTPTTEAPAPNEDFLAEQAAAAEAKRQAHFARYEHA